MFPNLSTDYDSSSRCSTASPVGDTLMHQQSPADSLSSACASPQQNTQEPCTDMDTSAAPFVPTVTAISTTPDLQWMVQPTIITSVSPSLGRAQTYKVDSSVPSTPKAGGCKGGNSGRKGKCEPLSPEEEEKKRIRRERNKMAAAKCRNRRRELTDTLQAETDKLEEDKAALQTEIANLLKEKEKLELILAAHKPVCKITEDLDSIFQDPISSPQLLSGLGTSKLSEDTALDAPPLQDTDASGFPTTAISGNSNILLCSSAEVNINDLEPSLDMKEEPLDDLLPSLDKSVTETARSVPDIDLTSSLGVSDWETLYKSVSSDLEALSAPMTTCTPTCTSYLSAFAFTYPEFDLLGEGASSPKGGASKADSVADILNSPTLLAL